MKCVKKKYFGFRGLPILNHCTVVWGLREWSECESEALKGFGNFSKFAVQKKQFVSLRP